MLHLLLPLLQAPTEFETVEGNLLPIVFAALFLDVAIVAIWYFIGVIINNSAVRESAKGEYYQFIGTCFLIVLLVWGITTYASVATTVLNGTNLMSTTQISALCANVETTSNLDILGSTNSLLSGAQTPSGDQLTGICTMVNDEDSGSQAQSSGTLTDEINYPLAASAVVTANLTSQTANNLNAAYTVDAYIGFLSGLSPIVAICFAEPPSIPCIVPGGALFASADPYFRLALTYAPYAGYSLIFQGLGVIGTLLNLSFESFVAQMLLITIILYIWPYLFFAGIVLRSTFFTRKLGGLLIAIVLGAVIVFPTIFAMEYLTLGNGLSSTQNLSLGTSSSVNAIYGFNAMTSIPTVTTDANGNTTTGNYIVNFFVQPSIQNIASANGCWPKISLTGVLLTTLGGLGSPILGFASAVTLFSSTLTPNPLGTAEMADVLYLLNPLTNLGSGAGQLLTGSGTTGIGTFYLPAYCPPQGALSTMFEVLNAYGVIGVTAYFLPIINIIITLSAIIGMSGLMGGNTSLEGLTRFI